jgi:hypothetical protein
MIVIISSAGGIPGGNPDPTRDTMRLIHREERKFKIAEETPVFLLVVFPAHIAFSFFHSAGRRDFLYFFLLRVEFKNGPLHLFAKASNSPPGFSSEQSAGSQ